MGNILMLYASTTGNTELMAEAIVAYLENKQHQVIIKTFDFDPIDVEELLDYDAVLVGTHTWDDGDLPYEVEDFYEELDEVDITGQIAGVFGSADSFYDNYGGAIDLIGVRLENIVPPMIHISLKLNSVTVNRYLAHCQEYTKQHCVILSENKGKNKA